jgi:replicative DNA helicase
MNSRGTQTIYYATNSHGLAQDVAALLLRLGIVARIKSTAKPGYRPGFLVWVYGADAQRRFLQTVGAFGPRTRPAEALGAAIASRPVYTNVDTLPPAFFRDVQVLMRQQGVSARQLAQIRGTAYAGGAHFAFAPSRAVAAEYAEILGDPELYRAATSDLFWDRVQSITLAGEEQVFDLTVPGPHCWLTDGQVVHNSGALEQDSDLVLFLWREKERGPDDTQEEGEVVNLDLAKHRNGPTGEMKLYFRKRLTRFYSYAESERYAEPEYA